MNLILTLFTTVYLNFCLFKNPFMTSFLVYLTGKERGSHINTSILFYEDCINLNLISTINCNGNGNVHSQVTKLKIGPEDLIYFD